MSCMSFKRRPRRASLPRRERSRQLNGGWWKLKSIIDGGRTRMTRKSKSGRKLAPLVTGGSGNVFADLGLPNPEQELLKAQLTAQIYTILKASEMKQVEAAKILGVRQPQVSL